MKKVDVIKEGVLLKKTAIRSVALIIIFLFSGCSTGDYRRVAAVALSRNPAAAAERVARNKVIGYALNPAQLERDIKNFKLNVTKLVKAAGGVWGDKNVKVPTPKQYVKYTQNYQSRAMVDFDKGIIKVETLDDKDPKKSLRNALVTVLLTPDDPRAVDMYSSKQVELKGKPYLYGEVLDNENRPISSVEMAEGFADFLVREKLKTGTLNTDSGEKKFHYVEISMVNDHLYVRAKKYSAIIEQYAAKYNISRNLVYSIIKTESDFNPFAVSSTPAFGLMQIVPSTAGRDSYRFVYNKDAAPSRDFLFDAENNVELGTAYLNILSFRYLENVGDPVSKEYCVIASYNGGIGAVLRAFSRDREKALNDINSMKPQEVFNRLTASLPPETQNYLKRVTNSKRSFVKI